MTSNLVTLLSIGGSDPCGGAGIQIDTRVAASLGLHPLSAVTALTVQNSHGIDSLNPVSPELLSSQLETILQDITPAAVKIGMIGSIENGVVISSFLKDLSEEVSVIVDPVLTASVGGDMFQGSKEEMMDFYQQEIFPLADAVTPNLVEAREFIKFNSLKHISNPVQIAISLLRLWDSGAVILKGGHGDNETVTDILADNFDGSVSVSESSHKRIECRNLHGSGCVFSSLLASYMALGFPLYEAFRKTSLKIYEIIVRSCDYRLGDSSYGPLNVNDYRL